MSHHTGAAAVCQQPLAPSDTSRTETTPPTTSQPVDGRLVARYGARLLAGGYTALPTDAYRHYHRLGVTEAEFVFIGQVCTYWWGTQDPYPSEETLAERMGKTVRTIQTYIASLKAKGLLHISIQHTTHGQRVICYDLRPFFQAVAGLARLRGHHDDAGDAARQDACARGDTPATPVITAQGHPASHPVDMDGDKMLCVVRDEESCTASAKNSSRPPKEEINTAEQERFDLERPLPLDTASSETLATETESTDRLLGQDRANAAERTPIPDVLSAAVARVSVLLGDEAPPSSVARAEVLRTTAGLPVTRFMPLVAEAARRTQARQKRITRLRQESDIPNAMPYFFAVLTDLLHPAPPHTRTVPPPAHHYRSGPRDKGGRGATVPPVPRRAAFSAVELQSITETHPVWRAALDDLALGMTIENFNTWLAPTRALSQEGDCLRIAVPAPFHKVWLEHKLHGRVQAVLQRLGYGHLQLAYVVATGEPCDARA